MVAKLGSLSCLGHVGVGEKVKLVSLVYETKWSVTGGKGWGEEQWWAS